MIPRNAKKDIDVLLFSAVLVAPNSLLCSFLAADMLQSLAGLDQITGNEGRCRGAVGICAQL